MAFLQPLLSSCIIILNILSTFDFVLAINNQTTTLPDYIRPTQYKIALSKSSDNDFYLDGSCEIQLTITSPTQDITFHMQEGSVIIFENSCILQDMRSFKSYRPIKYTFNNDTATLTFEDVIRPDHYVLQLKFATSLSNDGTGFFTTSYINKEQTMTLFASCSGTRGARQIFPCWDEPTIRATFDIDVYHDNKSVALSTGDIKTCKGNNHETPNYKWTCFYRTPLIPAYLVSIVVSDFLTSPVQFFLPPSPLYNKVNLYYRKKIKLYLKLTKTVLETVFMNLISQFKNCKSTSHIIASYVLIPGAYPSNAQNSPGLIFYRETDILYDEKSYPVVRKINVALLLAREMIHQCFNNMGHPSWWSNSWVNKGIVMLYTEEFIKKAFPDAQKMLELYAVQIQQESLRLDIPSIMEPLSEIEGIHSHSSLSYHIKAPCIVRMLQHTFNPNVLENSTKQFLEEIHLHGRNNITYNDFWTILQSVHDASDLPDSYDIRDLINTLTQLNHCPVIYIHEIGPKLMSGTVVNMNVLNQTLFLRITVQRFDLNGTPAIINDLYTVKFGPDLVDNQVLFPLLDSDWLLCDIQQAGYYRVNYEFKIWNLANIHLMKNPTMIQPGNRARLIDDAFYFMMNKMMSVPDFVSLIMYLTNETDYIAWYPMIKAIEHMSGFFLFERSVHIKTIIQKLLTSLVSKIGFVSNSTDDANTDSLRQEAVKWACNLFVPECTSAVTMELHNHLFYRERILPWWKKWIYCNGVITNDENWSKMFKLWSDNSHEYVLEYLPCSTMIFDHLHVITHNLQKCDLKKVNCKNVTEINNRLNTFLSTVARYARDTDSLNRILFNFDEMKPREVSSYVLLINIINNLYEEKHLETVLKFIKHKEKDAIKTFETNFMFYDGSIMNISAKGDEFKNKITELIKSKTLLIEEKINTRSSEILNHLDYFHHLDQKIEH